MLVSSPPPSVSCSSNLRSRCEEANRFSAKVVRTAQGTRQQTFVEAYGTGRIVEHANNVLRNLNIKGLAAFDLRTSKEDGTPWDFSKASDRKNAILYIRENKPSWLVGSPPCTAFSQLQGLNFKNMHPDRVKAILKEGRRHLHFVISLYKIQIDAGRHFLHEHPAGARSWIDLQMQRLLSHPRVSSVVSDKCQYGLTTPGNDGEFLPAKKPTRWASTSPHMLKRLSARCPADHEHQHLMGGRAAHAAYYPPMLITNILRGMRDTADAEHQDIDQDVEMTVAMAHAGALHDVQATSLNAAYREDDLNHENAKRTVNFKFLNGYSKTINLDGNFKDKCKDECTMEQLPRE